MLASLLVFLALSALLARFLLYFLLALRRGVVLVH